MIRNGRQTHIFAYKPRQRISMGLLCLMLLLTVEGYRPKSVSVLIAQHLFRV